MTGCDEEVEEVLPGTILGLTLLRSITIIKSTRCISNTETKTKLIEVFQVRRHDERSSSPEHSGIPAIPVVITARRPPTEQVQPCLHLLKVVAANDLKIKSFSPGLHE